MDQPFDTMDIHVIDYYHFSSPIGDYHERAHIGRRHTDWQNCLIRKKMDYFLLLMCVNRQDIAVFSSSSHQLHFQDIDASNNKKKDQIIVRFIQSVNLYAQECVANLPLIAKETLLHRDQSKFHLLEYYPHQMESKYISLERLNCFFTSSYHCLIIKF